MSHLHHLQTVFQRAFSFCLQSLEGEIIASILQMRLNKVPIRQQFVAWCLSVMSNCLSPYGLQHTRLPCPSLSPLSQ